MKENRYDDPIFFEKYSQMERSKSGLEGAGEWKTLEAVLPDFQEKAVVDLGCGYGWHCNYAALHGAKSVIGVDISARMLEIAREKTRSDRVTYLHQAIEDVCLPDASADIVLSSLALHYIESFDEVVKKVFRLLKPGGVFVFSVEHPLFTAYGSQDWYYDSDGKILHFPVDRYFEEGWRMARFLGEPVKKYHRTLTAYLDGLLTQGFVLERAVEPMPPQEMMDLPGMKDELRRPMMLILRAKKE